MKTLFLCLTLVLGCSSDDSSVENDTIIGTWQLTGKFDGGSPTPDQSIENGKIISFGENGSFTDSSLEPCDATFSIEGDIITIDASCRDEKVQFGFDFENGKLRMAFVPSPCDEGCFDVYTRR